MGMDVCELLHSIRVNQFPNEGQTSKRQSDAVDIQGRALR